MANGHGGKRDGAGRKPKADEQKLVEELLTFHDDAVRSLKLAVKAGESWAVKLYLERLYGKPRETVANTHSFEDDIPWPSFMNESKS